MSKTSAKHLKSVESFGKKTTENCTLVKLYKIKSKIDIKKNKINIG